MRRGLGAVVQEEDGLTRGLTQRNGEHCNDAWVGCKRRASCHPVRGGFSSTIRRDVFSEIMEASTFSTVSARVSIMTFCILLYFLVLGDQKRSLAEVAKSPTVPRLFDNPNIRNSAQAITARERLVSALAQDNEDVIAIGDPFSDVIVSISLPEEQVHHSDGHGADDKYFVRDWLQDENCIVYAAGLAGSVRFEEAVAKETKCIVHAFDCTLTSARPEWGFLIFHEWCIGREQSFEGNLYSKSKTSANESFIFKSLGKVKRDLGHPRIDLLKMDIEGFEWDLLESSLLDGPNSDLPRQLLFELHAEGANAEAVPPSIAVGRSKAAVDLLFLNLFDRGYRVIARK